MLTSESRFRPFPKLAAPRRLGVASQGDFGPSIKMISWNMFKARRRGWLLDLESLTAGVELVLLQEAVLHGGLAHPFHLASGMEWIMAETLANGGGTTTGPKSGSRVKAIYSEALRSPDNEPLLGTPKSALITTYPFSDTTLMAINVHAINFVPLAKFARQVEQIAACASGHKGPCIVAGDFNTWNRSRLNILGDIMKETGMRRVPAEHASWLHLKRVLDHVFYRDLRLMSARSLPHVKTSDHVPLWAEFGMPLNRD